MHSVHSWACAILNVLYNHWTKQICCVDRQPPQEVPTSQVPITRLWLLPRRALFPAMSHDRNQENSTHRLMTEVIRRWSVKTIMASHYLIHWCLNRHIYYSHNTRELTVKFVPAASGNQKTGTNFGLAVVFAEQVYISHFFTLFIFFIYFYSNGSFL